MRIDFVAGCIGMADEDGVLTVGFTDAVDIGPHSLILQNASAHSQQDCQLGHDREYLEWQCEDPAAYWSGYGAVVVCELHREYVLVRLTPEAANGIGGTDEIVVRLRSGEVRLGELRDSLLRILGKEGRFVDFSRNTTVG